MGTDKKTEFLTVVLGADGAGALKKALDKSPQLSAVLLPRTILSWTLSASNWGYEGPIPGVAKSFINLRRSETPGLYSGAISTPAGTVTFVDTTLYRLAAHLALTLDVDPRVAPELKDVDLARLGKSIDVLTRANLLSKARPGPKLMSSHGNLQVVHSNMGVHPYEIRRTDGRLVLDGIPSLADAQKFAGAHADSADDALHAAVEAARMSKVEPPGSTHKPTPQDGPQEAQPPQKQPRQAAPQAPKDQAPKGVKAPARTPEKVPGLPATPTVKLPKQAGEQPTLKVGKSEAHGSRCRICRQTQFRPDGGFYGCLCLTGLAKFSTIQASNDYYVITFGDEWDQDAREVLVEALYSQQS